MVPLPATLSHWAEIRSGTPFGFLPESMFTFTGTPQMNRQNSELLMLAGRMGMP